MNEKLNCGVKPSFVDKGLTLICRDYDFNIEFDGLFCELAIYILLKLLEHIHKQGRNVPIFGMCMEGWMVGNSRVVLKHVN